VSAFITFVVRNNYSSLNSASAASKVFVASANMH
jgi:hypothetical protein